MERKKIIAVIVFLIIIPLLISILNAKKNLKIKSVVGKTQAEDPGIQQESFSLGFAQTPAFEARPAITRIKPPPEKEAEQNLIKKRLTESQGASSSGSGKTSAADNPAAISEGSDSGITKIGIYPPEDVKEEMAAHGVVMY